MHADVPHQVGNRRSLPNLGEKPPLRADPSPNGAAGATPDSRPERPCERGRGERARKTLAHSAVSGSGRSGGGRPPCQLPAPSGLRENEMAGWTGLEPATSDVTGRRSNQLNYHPARVAPGLDFSSWWAVQDSNL